MAHQLLPSKNCLSLSTLYKSLLFTRSISINFLHSRVAVREPCWFGGSNTRWSASRASAASASFTCIWTNERGPFPFFCQAKSSYGSISLNFFVLFCVVKFSLFCLNSCYELNVLVDPLRAFYARQKWKVCRSFSKWALIVEQERLLLFVPQICMILLLLMMNGLGQAKGGGWGRWPRRGELVTKDSIWLFLDLWR